MSRRAPRRLSAALDGLTATLIPPTKLARVQLIWAHVVGEAIAEAGHPTAERDGLLTVTCSDSVWAQEIELMGAELVGRINEALGEELIQRLRSRAR